MNILVIGCYGFIGSHVVQYFENCGNNVFGADIMPFEGKNYFYIDPLINNYLPIFESYPFDICVIASGTALIQHSFIDPQNDYKNNTELPFRILDAIRKFQPNCKVISFSSAAVYGNPVSLPIDEKLVINPISPYGYHKAMSELVCKEFYHCYSIQTLSLRIFSVYGPGLKRQLLWDLYQKMKLSSDIIIDGTGKESRDFIFIDDLCKVLDIIIERASFDGNVINVANGKEIFIGELVKYFFETLAWKGNFRFSGTNRKGDPLNWKSDISLLKSLGYTQEISFEDGVKNYVKWLKENVSD